MRPKELPPRERTQARAVSSEPYTEAMPVHMSWGAPLTVDDIADAPADGHRYELIDGTLIVTPVPSIAHQIALGELLFNLYDDVPADMELLPGPIDWVAGTHTVFTPDVVVVRRTDIVDDAIGGPPVLVVEVLLPATRAIDLGTKRVALGSYGVPTYWVIDPVVPSLTAFHNDGTGTLVEVATVIGDDAYETNRPFATRVVPANLLLVL